MTVATKELTVTEKNEALFVERVIDYLDDGDICFAPVAPREPAKRILALGTALAGQPVVIKTVAVTEADIMNEALDMLRTGVAEPVVTMDEATLNAIEDEHIGAEFSTQPYLF